MKLTKSLCRKLMRKQLGTRGIPRIQWAAASDHNPLGKKAERPLPVWEIILWSIFPNASVAMKPANGLKQMKSGW